MARYLFFLFAMLCLAGPRLYAQNSTKTINIVVTDASTGKPVEGAEVSYKTLFGKQSRKSNAEGKVSFEVVLVLETGVFNFEVKDGNPSRPHKTYSNSIEISRNKDIYEFSASIQPDVRKLTLMFTDEKAKPLLDATIFLRDEQGHEMKAKTDNNGQAGFEVAPNTYQKTTLTIEKNGFKKYTMPFNPGDQTTQATIVATLAPNEPAAQYDLAGPTTNVVTTAPAPGAALPRPALKLSGPYQPECGTSPLEGVPTFKSFAVVEEKDIYQYLSSSCLGAANDAIDALVNLMDSVEKVNISLRAQWSQAPPKTDKEKQQRAIKAFEENNSETLKAAGTEAYKKGKSLYEGMLKLAAGPELYALDCIWSGIKEYAVDKAGGGISEEASNLKKQTNENFEKAKKAMQKKLSDIRDRIAKGGDLTENDMKVFTDWEEVKTSLKSTTDGLDVILAYVNDPKKLLPYDMQANMALDAAEAMKGTLLTDCQIRACDQHIKDGISAGREALTAARKYKAQMLKNEVKWRQRINDYVTAHYAQADRGWEHMDSDDQRLEPVRSQWESWRLYHNAGVEAKQKTDKLEATLTRLGKLCEEIQPIATTLNGRIAKYEQLYKEGIEAAAGCDIKKAEGIVQQLVGIEQSACGHFFPKLEDRTSSELLNEKIKKAKESGKCKPAKGGFRLVSAVPNAEVSTFFTATESELQHKEGTGNYIFRLLNKPPDRISPDDKIPLVFAAECTDKEAKLTWDAFGRWSGGDAELPWGVYWDKTVLVGYSEESHGIVPSAQGTVNVRVPEYSGNRLILEIVVRYAIPGESSVINWVRYTYERE